ncbi:MAG TPA: YceI family protein [Longimicrobium sp.]|jgi:polyisoprenoid-binding protein YceI|nr:YceI family protein [Longimicrobium sp.]
MRVRSRSLTLLAIPALLAATVAAAPSVRPADAPGAAPVQWRIDQSHSELTFRIRHLVSRVSGSFNSWSGTITADPASLAGGSVSVDIQTASIDTNNERRDTHLRSADFFDAENHPTITFRSTRVVAQGRELQVHGNLTIRGVTKPVVLEGRMLEVGGAAGRRRIGFEAETRINRMDYGVSWNRAAEGGGLTLGDEVTISIAIEAVEQGAS